MTRWSRSRDATAAALAALIASGCATPTRLGDLSVITSKQVALDGLNLDTLPQTRNVEGEDLRWIVFLVPIGIPRLEGAVDDALAKGNGDLMTDVVISTEFWWLIVGRTGFKVKGTVVSTKSAAP